MHALRSYPGATGLILLAAVGAVSAGKWLHLRRRGVALATACVLMVSVIGLNVQFVRAYFGDYRHSPVMYKNFHVDLVEACEWVRPRLGEFDALLCTGRGITTPYITTLVALRYEPEQWFRDGAEAYAIGDWDLYTGFGKVHFLFNDVGFGPLRQLADNGREDRVLFIVRPGDLGFEKPVHVVRSPDGEPRLWICEETL